MHYLLTPAIKSKNAKMSALSTSCFFFVLLLLHNTYLAPALDHVRRELLPRNRFKCHKRMEGRVILLRWAGRWGSFHTNIPPTNYNICRILEKCLHKPNGICVMESGIHAHKKGFTRISCFWCGNKIQQHKAVRASTTTCCSTVRFDTFGNGRVG